MPIARFRWNVFLLASAQGLYLVSSVTAITFAGLVGQLLAENKLYATLPVALMILGTASSTIPMSLLMKRIGRRAGFMIGALSGTFSGIFAAFAIAQKSFVLFCVAMVAMGVYQACTQYYRFAAIETAPKHYLSRAVSLVLLGGVISAFIGPTLAVESSNLLAPVPFAGAFAMAGAVSIFSLLPIAFLKIPLPQEHSVSEGARPLRVIIRQPAFIAAVINAAASYGTMILVMTATPLAMSANGFAVAKTGSVIQWHVLAMFIPSFFTGTLIHRYGVLTILYAGMVLFLGGFVFAISGTAVWNFGGTLVFLGVAWNFLYVGGSTLLTEAYQPSEKAKIQGANEFIVFASAATGSFSSGWLFHQSGWGAVAYAMLPTLVITFLVTMWYQRNHKSAAVPEVI